MSFQVAMGASLGDHQFSDYLNASTTIEVAVKDDTRYIIPINLEVEDTPILALLFVISSIGLVGNLITIGIIICMQPFHKPTFMVIGTVAVADFFSVLQYICHLMVASIDMTLANDYGKLFMTLVYITAHASAAHVVLLFGLRYYLIAKPILGMKVGKRNVIIASILMWILSVVFGLAYYLARFKVDESDIGIVVLIFRGYLIVVPCLFMTVLHLQKIYKLKRSFNSFRISNDIKRMSKMILIIIMVYIVAAIIFPITFALNFFQVHSERDSKVIQICGRVTWLVNLSINPIIYFIYNPKVRRNISVIWRPQDSQYRMSKDKVRATAV
jgi:hypothetical protein